MNVKYDTDTNETSVGGVNERLNVETVVCPGKKNSVVQTKNNSILKFQHVSTLFCLYQEIMINR